MKIFLIWVLSLAAPLLPAQEVEEPAIPAAAVQKALEWMLKPDPKERAAAYRTFQLFGDEGSRIYRNTLEKALELHAKKIGTLLENERLNPFSELPSLIEELQAERERIYALILTDFQKEPSKVRMLRNEVDALSKLNKNIRTIASKDSAPLERSIKTSATALSEVLREISIIDEDGTKEAAFNFEDSLHAVHEGQIYLKIHHSIRLIQAEISALTLAHTTNETAAWPMKSQRHFARHLNTFRSLFALTPLRLEEKLSEASRDHSQDMASLGFFAHTSPVKNKRSPADRARLAGFQYRWTGENIYVGSSSPIAAYDAWFASDGHRFIMFAKQPNLLGIGLAGKHWTMMTGRD